jgi:hypothetical protein
MATREEMFPSKYLKAPDLKGKAVVVTIASAPIETLKTPNGTEERKTVLYFSNGAKKVLPLNRTNWDAVADICGENSDDWPGEKIELYPTKTELRGETVACIRVRRPAQGDIVAATKKTAAPAATKGKRPPGDDSDIDDEIPFLKR